MKSFIKFLSKKYKNPIIASSGTFGNGYEFKSFYDVSKLGGVTLKALTKEERKGNPHNRICETECGLLNSIGLQNKGVEHFIQNIYPKLVSEIDTHIHVNISGETVDEFLFLIEQLNPLSHLSAVELNVSCPNLEGNRIVFGTDEASLKKLVGAASKISKKPLVVKLSPNVASIANMAKVCEDAGANALSISNTFLGLKINIRTKKPYIANGVAGYSGQGIKPIVLRMVYEASKAVKIPIIGIGGVMSYEDVVEYMLAGASLVGVGAANLIDPMSSYRILKDFESYLKKENISAESLIGAMKPYFD